MVARFGKSQGYAAHLLDHTLAVALNSGLDPLQLVQRAERQQPSDPSQRAWYRYTLGLALYRAGKFEQATACLQQLLQTDGQWRERVLAWLVLAMAHGRRGEMDQARQWLERANQWYAVETRKFPQEARGGIPPSWTWQDWLSFQLLHQEAVGLLKRAGTDPPARKVNDQSPAKTPDR